MKNGNYLNNKQIKFCEEYLKDFNATQAAVRAGYSTKTAYSIGNENLRKPEIKNFIDRKKMEITNQTNLSILTLIDDLALIKQKCIHEKFDPSNAIKACELLSKFLDQHNRSQKEYLSKMSLEELEEFATKFYEETRLRKTIPPLDA